MTNRPTALYIHWPFCLSKCPYCDFNSHVRDAIDQDRWRAALLADLDIAAGDGENRDVTSIFFGGGTPSLMDARTVGALIERAALHWTLGRDAEITLEANPTSVEAGRLADYRAAGVNRVSLGVQALDDTALRFLGREHSAGEALAAIEAARRLFGRFSFDLIYGRPGQTPDAWRAELARALTLAGDHLSLYQLTLEPRTAFYRRARAGEALILDEDGTAALYEITQAMLDAAGLPAYEISNHARPGAECRHNLAYWRYGDYIGVGPGAHGRVTTGGEKTATQRIRSPEAWLDALDRGADVLAERTILTPGEQMTEAVMMGLRLAEGLPLSRLRAIGGAAADGLIDARRVEELVEEGFLDASPGVLRATAAGRERLDAMLGHLLA
jgi:putative oxygen-independent coproporphyrinogen III oxidase